MYAKLVLLGDGTPEDGYRVDLPTYNMVEVDYQSMTAIVAVGARQTPKSLPAPGSPLYPLIGNSYVLIGLPTADLAAWWATLAHQYPGRNVPYQPNFP